MKVASAPKSAGLAVDVVPCIQYRSYFRFFGGDSDYLEGMTFETDELLFSKWIVNYPKVHFILGADKNGDDHTKGWFKPLVRIFKNARNVYNEDAWTAIRAPSYFIECLLSQMPDDAFGQSFQLTYLNALNWLLPALHSPMASACLCQNRQMPLFGDRPEQWNLDEARSYVSAMFALWKDWK